MRTVLLHCRPEADVQTWREACLWRAAELGPVLEELHEALERLDYTGRDCKGICLALDEAVANGFKHGNQHDASKSVRVSFRADSESVLLKVKDEGPGFDPTRVPDPTVPENLDGPSGRGLALMRHYASWLCYLGRGNALILCKYRLPT